MPADILYIEDNLSVALTGLRRLFLSTGMAGDHVANVRQALDYLAQHSNTTNE